MSARSDAFGAELRRLEKRVRRQADIRAAVRRVGQSLPAILQILLAVAAAYAITHWGLGHAVPLLAVTVTINSLGFAGDARPVRVAETVLGIVLGVVLGDALALLVGRGLWQLLVVLATVLLLGRLLARSPSFSIAAAVPSALVVMLPDATVGTFARSLDALIGGAVALLVTALVPRDPRRAAARDARALFSVVGESLVSLEDALRHADSAAAELALARLRRTQPLIDAWTASLDTAVSIARISPWVRPHLGQLRRLSGVLRVADLTVRHLRTLSRRVDFLVRDGRARPELAELVARTGRAVRLLGASVDDPVSADVARLELVGLAERLDPQAMLPGAPVTDAAVVLLFRPLLVDLLDGAGLDPAAARALLPKLD